MKTEAWAWINSKFVGHRPYKGACERPNKLSLEVSNALLPGKTNVIALRIYPGFNRAVAGGL